MDTGLSSLLGRSSGEQRQLVQSLDNVKHTEGVGDLSIDEVWLRHGWVLATSNAIGHAAMMVIRFLTGIS